MANLPANGNARLRELKSKVDELLDMAEGMKECYDDRWDDYDYGDDSVEFYEQSELLVKVLEQFVIREEFDLLWEATAYAIGRFLYCSNAEMESVQEFISSLVRGFLEAVQSQASPSNEAFRLFMKWEEKVGNCDYGVLSEIFVGLPADVKERWITGALEEWRGYPPRHA